MNKPKYNIRYACQKQISFGILKFYSQLGLDSEWIKLAQIKQLELFSFFQFSYPLFFFIIFALD